jgi:hypothetical protein
LQCAGVKDATCLSSAQVAALERAFGGPRTSSGKALYVGQAWDPGIGAPGWRQWKLGTSQTGAPNAANATLMAGALAHEFFTPPDPAFAITAFDFDRDPARMDAFSAVFDTYRDATLAAFRKRGGKLLIFHGTADPILFGAGIDRLLPAAHAKQRRRQGDGRVGAPVPDPGHESLRWRSGHRQLRRPWRDHTVGREGKCTRTDRGVGASFEPVLCRADASALCVPGGGSLQGQRQPRGRRELHMRREMTAVRRLCAGFLIWAVVSAGFPHSTSAQSSPVRGLYNWIHSTGNAERSFAFYHELFGIELSRSPFAGAAPANAPPERIRPAAEAGTDPLVWDLTNTHGSRFRTVFMRAPNTPFGSRAVRSSSTSPAASERRTPGIRARPTLVFTVRDLTAVVSKLKARSAPVVTVGGGAVDSPRGRAILVPRSRWVPRRSATGGHRRRSRRRTLPAEVIETSIAISVASSRARSSSTKGCWVCRSARHARRPRANFA